MGKWLNLTALLKAQVIQFAILNGVSNIKDIRDTFNIYANGGHLGHTYDGNKEQSQQLYIKQLPTTPIDTLGVRVLPSQIGSLNKGIYNLKSLTIAFDLDSGKVVSVGHGNVNDPDSFYNTFVVPSFDIGVLRYRNNPTELNSYFLVLEQNGGVNPSKGYKIVGNQPSVLIVEKQKPVIIPQELPHANIVEPVQKPLIKEVGNSLELNPILLVLVAYPVLNVEHKHANMLFMLPTNISAFLPLATRILENPEAYFASQPGISEKDKDYMINYSLFIMDEWNKLSPKQKKLLLPASVLSNSIILNNGAPKQYKQLKVFHSGKIRNKPSDDNKKSTGGPLYPFSFNKQTPTVRKEQGGEVGTNNNRPQDQPQISWIENWLNSRKDIMAKNIADTEFGNHVTVYSPENNTGDVRDAGFNVDYNYPIYNPLYWFLGQNPRIKQAEKIINREVQNIRNVPVTNVGNEYKPSHGMLGVYVEPSYFNNSGNYVAFFGTPKDEVKIHEFTHASNPIPQEYYIEQVLYKDNNIPKSVPGDNKHNQAKELYAALQEVRYKSGLKPNVVVNEQWLENNKKYFKDTYLEGLPNTILIRLFNELAQNSSPLKKSDNSYLAALGGSLSRSAAHWHQTGGPLYPFSFEKNTFLKTPVVRYDEGGHVYGFGDRLRNLFIPNTTETPVNTEPAPLDLAELASRQAYAESRFDSNAVSPANAIGLFLVTPTTLSYYNLKTGSNYTSKDLYNDVINLQVRDWYMNDLMIRPWNTKNNPSDSVLYAKSLGAYNWGPTNLVDTLNKAKANGIDIYNSWDWLPYLPTETRDYINFVLRNLSNSSHRNNLMYNKSVSKNLAKVSAIKSK